MPVLIAEDPRLTEGPRPRDRLHTLGMIGGEQDVAILVRVIYDIGFVDDVPWLQCSSEGMLGVRDFDAHGLVEGDRYIVSLTHAAKLSPERPVGKGYQRVMQQKYPLLPLAKALQRLLHGGLESAIFFSRRAEVHVVEQ